jgi:hypothetical protein
MIKFGSKLPKDILMKAVDKLPEVFKKRTYIRRIQLLSEKEDKGG